MTTTDASATPPASVLVLSTYYPPVLGGAETAASQLAEFLAANGRRVTVVTKRTSFGIPSDEVRNGVRVIRVQPAGERTSAGKWMAIPAMVAEMSKRRDDHDVVVCIDFRGIGLAALVARGLTGRPVIFQAATDGVLSVAALRRTLHGFGITAEWAQNLALWPIQRLYDGADAYPCISRAIEAETLKAGVSSQRVHYLPNPVDTQLFAPCGIDRKTELRQQFSIESNAKVAIVVGRLSREKGQLDALRAWKSVDIPGSLLVLAGPDMPGHPWDLGPEARAFVEREGLTSRVRFTGGLSPQQVPDWMRVADVAVQPSHFEAFGTSAIEAMAIGLPVIASDVGGLRDFVEPDTNGLRVPPQNAEALAAALQLLLSDGDRRARYADGAKRTAAQFDVRAVLGTFERLIDDVVAASGSR